MDRPTESFAFGSQHLPQVELKKCRFLHSKVESQPKAWPGMPKSAATRAKALGPRFFDGAEWPRKTPLVVPPPLVVKPSPKAQAWPRSCMSQAPSIHSAPLVRDPRQILRRESMAKRQLIALSGSAMAWQVGCVVRPGIACDPQAQIKQVGKGTFNGGAFNGKGSLDVKGGKAGYCQENTVASPILSESWEFLSGWQDGRQGRQPKGGHAAWHSGGTKSHSRRCCSPDSMTWYSKIEGSMDGVLARIKGADVCVSGV